jgi:hypothetical protein
MRLFFSASLNVWARHTLRIVYIRLTTRLWNIQYSAKQIRIYGKVHVFGRFYFFCGPAAPSGPWSSHSWGFLITNVDAPQSVGLLWTSDQLIAETSTLQHTTLTTDKHPCPPVGFEPTISTGKRPQTYAVDRAATGTGIWHVFNKSQLPSRRYHKNDKCGKSCSAR